MIGRGFLEYNKVRFSSECREKKDLMRNSQVPSSESLLLGKMDVDTILLFKVKEISSKEGIIIPSYGQGRFPGSAQLHPP